MVNLKCSILCERRKKFDFDTNDGSVDRQSIRRVNIQARKTPGIHTPIKIGIIFGRFPLVIYLTEPIQRDERIEGGSARIPHEGEALHRDFGFIIEVNDLAMVDRKKCHGCDIGMRTLRSPLRKLKRSGYEQS